MSIKQFGLVFVIIFFTLLLIYSDDKIDISNPEAAFQQAKQQEQKRNYKIAFDIYDKLLMNAEFSSAIEAYNNALNCLHYLNKIHETDAFREKVLKKNEANPNIRITVAESYLQAPKYGYLIENEFSRGYSNYKGGFYANSMKRDRTRALQILEGTKEYLGANAILKAEYHLSYANALMHNRSHKLSWTLQDLTNISVLPDFDKNYYGMQAQNAPVDKSGDPILYPIPDTFEKAENDGQRWRFHLEAAKKSNPKLVNSVDYNFASFLLSQWGVATLGNDWASKFDDKKEKSIYALEAVSDNEALCKLATGVKRFKFPEGYDYIKIFKSIANSDDVSFKRSATDQLGQIYENRRQYVKAAAIWQTALKAGWDNKHYQYKIKQIIGNWGQFEKVQPQLAGENATFQFRFRNTSKVEFTAYKIKISELLNDLTLKIKASKKIDWHEMNINQLGYRLVNSDKEKYASEVFKSWEEKLIPRPDHFDDLVNLKTPFSDSGAYLIKSKVENGNENYIVVFLSETTIVRKSLDKKALIYIADSKTGAPLANMTVELFGYRYEYSKNENKLVTQQFALNTNENGMIISDRIENNNGTNWLITARGENRFAYYGFQNFWANSFHEQKYYNRKTYGITDRPVYKPSQKVHFKFWDRIAAYDDENTGSQSDRSIQIEVNSPKGNKIFSENFKTDVFGGVNGSLDLPADATLGTYQMLVTTDAQQVYAIQFRVEEYKKPEFEVKVQMPEAGVTLGETVKAKIEAKYYFGAPVTKAKVKYKVLRTEHDFTWYPIGRWDWLYGNGYGWLSYDCDWYPGWGKWGCKRPYYWWWYRPAPQPEVVIENEVEIDENGVVALNIETKVFKDLYGDKNHKFQVIAEVVDASRRTIVGQGDIIVTSHPFKVFAWLDKGYYNEGDIIISNFQARTPNSSPVKGKGVVSLYEIKYNKDMVSSEKKIHSEKLDTDANGKAEYKFNAPKSGQYRISYELKSDGGEEEGAAMFNVYGNDQKENNLRFNDLEILTKESEYKPGDSVNLKINTNANDSHVLLFLRPENGVYHEPERLHLKTKSTDKNILITKKDMPNFFVEALTVRNGKLHVVTKEIIVPPENKALQVEILPNQEKYKPGQESVVKVKVTDMLNKPFQGSLVLSVYDKAIEYISGGSNTQNIKEFFWKWRRNHRPVTVSNLDNWFYMVYKNNTEQMSSIGYFGHIIKPASASAELSKGSKREKESLLAESSLAESNKMEMKKDSSDKQKEGGESPQEDAPLMTPTIRKDFADLAYWNGDIVTDANGFAQFKFKMPENLSTWKINSWVMGQKVEVGYNSIEVITTKDLLIRLQAPRFFVEKDEVVLSGIVHNYLPKEQKIKVVLEQFGDCISEPDNKEVWVSVPSNGEKRVDWRVSVLHPGEVKVRMSALNEKESDAMEMKFPVLVHGMMKMDSFSGVIKPEGNVGTIDFNIPDKLNPEASELVINYSPSLAGAMVDALPYLVDYPYGCTEQTLNRFIPTVITQKILLKMNLDLEKIKQKKVNLNAAELGDGKERAKRWQQWSINPVFDSKEVDNMTRVGLEKLYSMQNNNGGWGWFFDGENGESYPHTTATVVHGLRIAKLNNVAIIQNSLDRGISWLERYQSKRISIISAKKENRADNIDALVYKILAENNKENSEMRKYLMRDKSGLTVYSLCLMGMGFHALKLEKELQEVMLNIDQYLEQDEENQTAWLNINNSYWWYWYGNRMESNALYLTLLAKVDPKSQKASRLVKYILNNRKHATYWSSTRDTALCIEAIAEYWKESGEMEPAMTVEIWIDGKKKNTVEINKDNLFDFDNSFKLMGQSVTSGKHTIELRKKGSGPLYYNAYVSYFSKEDFIPKAGLDLRATRKIYKLVKDDSKELAPDKSGKVVKQVGDKMKRIPLINNAMIKSGDVLEIEITIESKNEYEYICIEDPKAAGFETVEARSGYNGNAIGAYVEYKNEKVVMFAQHLGHGKYSVSYKVRAEIPGNFSALPTKVYAMYAPELKGNSDENKIIIVD